MDSKRNERSLGFNEQSLFERGSYDFCTQRMRDSLQKHLQEKCGHGVEVKRLHIDLQALLSS